MAGGGPGGVRLRTSGSLARDGRRGRRGGRRGHLGHSRGSIPRGRRNGNQDRTAGVRPDRRIGLCREEPPPSRGLPERAGSPVGACRRRPLARNPRTGSEQDLGYRDGRGVARGGGVRRLGPHSRFTRRRPELEPQLPPGGTGSPGHRPRGRRRRHSVGLGTHRHLPVENRSPRADCGRPQPPVPTPTLESPAAVPQYCQMAPCRLDT